MYRNIRFQFKEYARLENKKVETLTHLKIRLFQPHYHPTSKWAFSFGKKSVNVDSPIDPVDQQLLSAAMDQILAANIFMTNGGELVAKKGARIVERNVTEIELS